MPRYLVNEQLGLWSRLQTDFRCGVIRVCKQVCFGGLDVRIEKACFNELAVRGVALEVALWSSP